MSTVASNGYAGVQISPRWVTNIYYNVRLLVRISVGYAD